MRLSLDMISMSSRRTYYKALLLCADAVLLNIAALGALFLRFEGQVPPQYLWNYLTIAIPYTLVSLFFLHLMGFYVRVWRYASLRDMVMAVKGITIVAVLLASGASALQASLPRSVYILNWFLAVAFLVGYRCLFRILAATGPGTVSKPTATSDDPLRNVLVVGAGEAGTMVLKEFIRHRDLSVRVVGLVDDDEAKLGMEIQGVRVIGSIGQIPALVDDYRVDEVIIAMPSAPGRIIRQVYAMCLRLKVRVRTLPGMYELLNGKVSLNQVREVQIEDLLGREPAELDVEKVAMYLRGRTVLITGAGGSIGAELCKQVIRFGPERLVMLDHDENRMFELMTKLPGISKTVELRVVIGDVRDDRRMDEVFTMYQPAVVFHAAARKHVHFMEQNPEEAIKTNIFGTINVAKNALKCGTSKFVLISTDKAVNPTNVMGATKRVAEVAVLGMNRYRPLNNAQAEDRKNTEYIVVRFGNVLGSNGSVVPLFRSQIARGGPVSVTDPRMTRYFMTITEAAQLVVQAGAMGEGGQILVLDMGEPVSIMELAEKMIRLSGYEPHVDIPIEVIGAHPGEKLDEELFGPGEDLGNTAHNRIFEAKYLNSVSPHIWSQIKDLEDSVWGRSGHDANTLLASMVSGEQSRREVASSTN